MKDGTWIAYGLVLSVVLVCFTWRLNVRDEQDTFREQNRIQRDALNTQLKAIQRLDYWQKYLNQPQNQSLDTL